MKNILLALLVSLMSLSANAQIRPGPGRPRPPHNPPPHSETNFYLIQSAERLHLETTRLEQAAVYQRLHPYAIEATRRLSSQTESLLYCVRSGGGRDGVGGSIDIGRGRINFEIGGGRRPQNCAQEIQRVDQEFQNARRNLQGLPYQNPVASQLSRVEVALQQVLSAQFPGPGHGPVNLVVTGQMNQIPFSFQSSSERAIENLCLEFGRARRIYRVDSLQANGRWVSLYRGAPLEEACRVLANEARP